MFVLRSWSTAYHRPSAWGVSLPSQSFMSALPFQPGKATWLPKTLDRLIKDQEDQAGHESTQASLCQWWMRNGRGREEGNRIQLASRKPVRHCHMHYATYFGNDTKGLVLLTSFSRLGNRSAEKAGHLSVKEASVWHSNPPSSHCSRQQSAMF